MRRLIVGSAVLALTVGWAAPATAAEPVHVYFPIEFEFEDTELSAECGFTVLVSGEGHFRGVINERPDGTAREVDQIAIRWTLDAPSTAESFDFVESITETFDYPEGMAVGAPSTVVRTGTLGHDPGVSATAGRLVFEGTIIGFSDEGLPLVMYDNDAPVTKVGRFPDFDVAALCAALD